MAARTFQSAVRAWPSVSMHVQTTAAPNSLARVRNESRRVPGSSPSSRLTELRTARPPIHDRAASTTGASVESTISGSGRLGGEAGGHLLHVGDAVGAGVVDAHVEDVGALLDLVAGHGHAGVPVGRRAWPRGTSSSRWRWCARRPPGTRCPGRRGPGCRSTPPRARARDAGAPGARPAHDSTTAARWAGVVPQQPPITETPSSVTNWRWNRPAARG